ncbi:MAG TPA: hypothetical protein VJQ25_13445 [Nitrospira sp.]|jgi:DNA-binding NtrC family response regulator|nr:hypothetical protein [Nitrospira sp.]
MATVLIADTDPLTIDVLPRVLSHHLPHVAVDICTSIEDLTRTRSLSSYDTIAISPVLLQGSRLFKHKADRHLLVPLLVTMSHEDRALASTYLEKDAFDLIVKPIVPQEASQTVCLALWQSRLLQLLTSKDRASSRFRDHMKAFPHALKAREEFASLLTAYERTFHALTTSLQHLLSSEEEDSLFDMAGFVESISRKRALDRLLNMCKDSMTQ